MPLPECSSAYSAMIAASSGLSQPRSRRRPTAGPPLAYPSAHGKHRRRQPPRAAAGTNGADGKERRRAASAAALGDASSRTSPQRSEQIKAALRARIAASGRTADEVFAIVERRVTAEVADIAAARERGETIWPVIDYADIAAGTVPAGRSRGCAGAAAWSCAATSAGTRPWVGTAALSTTSRATPSSRPTGALATTSSAASAPGPRSTRSTGPRPATGRQSDRMAQVQAFLNNQGNHQSAGIRWFDPDRDSLYPDRIRRRPPGADSACPWPPSGPRLPRPVDDPGLPAGLPPPVRRHRRAVRPLGCRLPHDRAAVSRHDDVLGVPHLPGLDRPVGHGSRPGRPAYRPDSRRHGLPHAAAAACRRPRRRDVRCHGQPGLPRQPRPGTRSCCRPSPASPTFRPATRSGGTAT